MITNVWCLWWFFILVIVIAQDPIAHLPQGRVVGIKVFTENLLTPIEIYYGIPYATPPIGRYRFSAPEKHPGWRRTLFAHRMPPRCPQYSEQENDYNTMSEDCLYLNIWTPRQADGKALPVAVILYSESWEKSGPVLPCQELAGEGLVVVSISYRLHLLSFFSLRSLLARGNLAILDQYLALLWVRDNIAAFGGDPTAITLIGHSAGADSVLQHMFSPRALGLFQRAIIMSPQNLWQAIDKQKEINSTEIEKISRKFAKQLGCSSKVDEEILQCLRSRPLSDIVSFYSKVDNSEAMQPIHENFLPMTEQYITNPLYATLSAGKQQFQLDLLFGTTDLEVTNSNEKNYTELFSRELDYINEYINSKAIPDTLKMFQINRLDVLPMLIEAVRWEYWGSKALNNGESNAFDSIEALYRMHSAATMGAGGALLAARLARRATRLHVYRYTEPASLDLHGRPLNFSGAVHGTDLVALLGEAFMLQIARRPPTANEKRSSSLFRKYIASFVKFGSPSESGNWPPYRPGNAHIHEIRFDGHTGNSAIANDAAFWLQYLPNLANIISTAEHTEQLTSVTGEQRLRGGVFAMCGVSVVLLLLLLACAILLQRERMYRSSLATESHH